MAFSKISFPFRVHIWWQHIIPPILGLVFVLSDGYRIITSHAFLLIQFVVTLISTAAFGYFINDWSDIESDRLGGKANAVARITPWQRYFIAGLLLIGAFLPWIWLVKLPLGVMGIILWLFELSALILYSIPPFRFKNKAIWGILCDTLYGHVLPIGIATAIFCGSDLFPTPILIVFTCLLFFKGFRNIITHQIMDRVADRKSKTHTFVRSFGVVKTVHLVNGWVLPIEISANLILGILLYANDPIWLYSFLGFMGWTLLVFDLPFYTYKLRYDRFWYFLNDYYEGWFPYISFILFLLNHRLSPVWLIVWAVIFFIPLLKLMKDIGNIIKNIALNIRELKIRIFKIIKKIIQLFF